MEEPEPEPDLPDTCKEKLCRAQKYKGESITLVKMETENLALEPLLMPKGEVP